MKVVLLTAAVAPRTPAPPAWASPPSSPPSPPSASFPTNVLSVIWSLLLESMAPPVAPPPWKVPKPPSARLSRNVLSLTVSVPLASASTAPPPTLPPKKLFGEGPATAWFPLREQFVSTTTWPNEQTPPPRPKVPNAAVGDAGPPTARLSFTTLERTV